MIDNTKYLVVTPGPFNASGFDEIVAAFTLKQDATAWCREAFGPKWRRSCRIVKRVEIAKSVTP